MGKEIDSSGFLAQNIPAILLVAENAYDAPGPPNRLALDRGYAALCKQLGDGRRGILACIEIIDRPYDLGLLLNNDPFSLKPGVSC